MNEKTLNTIKSFSKAGWIIALIAKILLFISLAVLVAATVIFIAMPDLIEINTTNEMQMSIDFAELGVYPPELTEDDFSDLKFSADGVEFTYKNFMSQAGKLTMDFEVYGGLSLMKYVKTGLVAAIAEVVVLLICTFMVSSICKSLKNCNSPFESSIISKVRTLAITLIPCAVAPSLIGAIAGLAFGEGSSSFSVSVNMTMVVLVIALFTLTFVLKYGASLEGCTCCADAEGVVESAEDTEEITVTEE